MQKLWEHGINASLKEREEPALGFGVVTSLLRVKFIIYIWVFPKIGKHPKMDGENNRKPS